MGVPNYKKLIVKGEMKRVIRISEKPLLFSQLFNTVKNTTGIKIERDDALALLLEIALEDNKWRMQTLTRNEIVITDESDEENE